MTIDVVSHVRLHDSAPTTIKLSKATRDRLKKSAARHSLSIEEHLNFLEDLHDREQRWDSMRDVLSRMSAEEWAEYKEEASSISGSSDTGLDNDSW